MAVEFDAAKRDATLDVSGRDMARTGEVSAGATLTVEDDEHDYGEDRFITIGFLDGRIRSCAKQEVVAEIAGLIALAVDAGDRFARFIHTSSDR